MQHGTCPGHSTALSKQEENSLVSYILYMADRGFPLEGGGLKKQGQRKRKRSPSPLSSDLEDHDQPGTSSRNKFSSSSE